MSAATSGTAKVTLPRPDQILIERTFAAPAHDLRVGGSWRYAMRPEGGQEFAFYGEFLEIVPDERIVQTETFAPFPDDSATSAMTLIERDGVTLLSTLVQHTSTQARDMHINSGMEGGMQDAFDRLEALAISLAD
jgi:uncharacterized protein YndB with AHSA1/START domain